MDAAYGSPRWAILLYGPVYRLPKTGDTPVAMQFSQHLENPTKPTELGYVGFVGTYPGHIHK